MVYREIQRLEPVRDLRERGSRCRWPLAEREARPSASQERLTDAAMTSCARSQPSPLSLATRSLPSVPASLSAQLALSAACPVPCDLPSIDLARPVPRFPRPRFPALSAPAHTHPLTASTHYRPTSVPHACSESRRPAPTLCGIIQCHWIIPPARALAPSRREDPSHATVLYAPLRCVCHSPSSLPLSARTCLPQHVCYVVHSPLISHPVRLQLAAIRTSLTIASQVFLHVPYTTHRAARAQAMPHSGPRSWVR